MIIVHKIIPSKYRVIGLLRQALGHNVDLHYLVARHAARVRHLSEENGVRATGKTLSCCFRKHPPQS